jgi:hypothetical protein
MSDLKDELQRVFDLLKGVETRARGLKNQNLADIAASAHGRVKQLLDHPDTELVEERKDQAHPGNPLYVAPATKDEAIERMRKDGEADPENTARMNWPHLFGAGPFKSEPGDPNALPSYPELAKESQHAGAPFPQAQHPQPMQSRPLGADEYPRTDGR